MNERTGWVFVGVFAKLLGVWAFFKKDSDPGTACLCAVIFVLCLLFAFFGCDTNQDNQNDDG